MQHTIWSRLCAATARWRQRLSLPVLIADIQYDWRHRRAACSRSLGPLALSICVLSGSYGLRLTRDFNTAPETSCPADEQGQCDGAAPGSKAELDALINRTANQEGVDPALVRAVVRAESDYDPRSLSSAGAMGLMQLMPETARDYNVKNPWDPAQNIRAGTRYLRYLLSRFGDERLAIAAYNAGPGSVTRYGGVPPYRETQHYVTRVLTYRSES